MTTKQIRHLRKGDRIVMDGAPAEVRSAEWTKQLIGGDNLPTTAALRVLLADGTDFLAHPQNMVEIAPDLTPPTS